MNLTVASGMYVRVGIDHDREDLDFRDYRIAQVAQVDPATNTATLTLWESDDDVLMQDLDSLERCRILPDTPAIHRLSLLPLYVLMACEEDCPPGELRAYYVQCDDHVERMTEDVLAVAAHRQDPDPFDQLRRYELHEPIWREQRDRVAVSYAELHNATFGIEDLVGSRILLLAHQAEVVATVLGSPECRYLLADEVGLGKTVEASVILKGLRRRHPDMRTLIVTPSSVLEQWHNELDAKFWLDFPVAGGGGRPSRFNAADDLGAMVSAEDLASEIGPWHKLAAEHWGLLIVDEAHHLRKDPLLFDRIHTLSMKVERVLLLSATPIQRDAEEYLALLSLMDPVRYQRDDPGLLKQMLQMQSTIRDFTSYQARGIADDVFDADEFIEELAPIVGELGDDGVLARLAGRVSKRRHDERACVAAAGHVLAYLSENYRLERRILRNRRAHLTIGLPTRTVDASYCYDPDIEEAQALDALLSYLAACVQDPEDAPLTAEYCRLLLFAAGSSPYALAALLDEREAARKRGRRATLAATRSLLTPASPRQERARAKALAGAVPPFEDEAELLKDLRAHLRRWCTATDAHLESETTPHPVGERSTGKWRLGQALRAIDDVVRAQGHAKVLVFTAWPDTLEALKATLEQRYRSRPDMLAFFHAGMDAAELQRAADRFQESERCRVMVCDELGGEGRNFQAAGLIIHVDIPWTPAQIEQRIGRVDRLGRTGSVRSVVLFAREWPEHDLFRIWDEAFMLFTQSMSGMEYVLEGVQNELAVAVCTSPRDGLRNAVDDLALRADALHREVEKERYFERPSVDNVRRKMFQDTCERYRDGQLLRVALLKWADLAGLHSSSPGDPDIVTFDPRQFSEASMKNAKLICLPDMREALQRSLRPHELVIRGTFARDLAVQREDLVFFAPGTDPWTDGLIANALEADRGRCCGILRAAPVLQKSWRGFELLFNIMVDPRPLYALGYGPVHLFRAQGYLMKATYRVLISADGEIVGPDHPVAKLVKEPYKKTIDRHLGKRDGGKAMLRQLRQALPPDQWTAIIVSTAETTRRHLDEQFSYMEDEAKEAHREYQRRAAGWRAARQWLGGDEGGEGMADIEQYEQISEALVEGIRRPLVRLESACFWWLQGGVAR